MQRLILDQQKISLSYQNHCLIIQHANETTQSLPLGQLNQVICLHNTQISSQLLGQFKKHHIDFIVINQKHSQYSVALYAHQHNQVVRRCIQYQWQQSSALRLPLVKSIYTHKLRCAIRVLQTREQSQKTVTQLQLAMDHMHHTNHEEPLRGIEGAAQRQVFAYWRSQLSHNLGFNKRQRRPPPDPVNSLLSLTYTLIYHAAIRSCLTRALDSQLGFFHRPAFGRHSLACDIMEPVRPSIENWVVDLFTQGHLSLRHFSQNSHGCLLGKEGRQIYYAQVSPQLHKWQRPLDSTAHWLSMKLDSHLGAQHE